MRYKLAASIISLGFIATMACAQGGFQDDVRLCAADQPCFDHAIVDNGEIYVHWTSDQIYGHYNVRVTRPGWASPQIERKGGDAGDYRFKIQKGPTYTVSVQGCHRIAVVGSSRCSPWSAEEVPTLVAPRVERVYGLILQKWNELGAATGFLGIALTAETGTPDGIGRFNHFRNGSIYWTPNTGAHEVHGFIRDKWKDLGWERSFLGYPLTDESRTPDGIGRYNHFQGGSIYWTPNTGAHEVHGFIRDKWKALGWERSFLGYPLTDETRTPDGVGRYNHFQNGSIYWTPSIGAHEVHGAIRDKWSELGWERSCLLYPTSDEFQAGNARRSNFQNGTISWTPETGAIVNCYGTPIPFPHKLLPAPGGS